MAALADDREGRARLCRYATRPAIADERLSETADGRIAFALREPRRIPAPGTREAGAPETVSAIPPAVPVDSTMSWAALLKRVCDIDALCCPQCRDPMRILTAIISRSARRETLILASV